MSVEIPRSTGGTVGCMATFPARFDLIAPSIASIAPQLDRLYIYVNETTEGFPDVTHLGNVTVIDGRDHAGDLSANGKIYPLSYISDALVFTLDDDFIFPPDYVARYRAVFDLFDNRCCVTTHGSVMAESLDWYYERNVVRVAQKGLPQAELISLAGSGTFAFHQKTLPCTPDDFLPRVMVDLAFSTLAQDAGLPIWCIARPEGWLQHIPSLGLWEEFREGRITHHTDEARKRDWSFAAFRPAAQRALATLDAKRAAGAVDFDIAPDHERAIREGGLPESWRATTVGTLKRQSYLTILNAI